MPPFGEAPARRFAAGSEPLRQMRDRAGAEGDVDEGKELEQPLTLSLGVTAADGNDALRISRLQRPCLGQVRGETLIGLLTDRARVEDHDVRLRLGRRLAEPELFEQPLDPLGVVGVHLAPEGRDVVALHFANSTALLSRMTVTLIWPGYSS